MATWWWALQHRLHFFDVIDFVAPLVPPGLGFGRLGNFINAELWGKYTDAAWGVIFPGAEAPLARLPPAELQAQYASGALDRYARHPSPLYQALLEGVVMFVVLWWYRSEESRVGQELVRTCGSRCRRSNYKKTYTHNYTRNVTIL